MSCWADKQDHLLWKLVRRNEITYQNLEPNYLFKVMQTFFPDYIGEGTSAQNTAIQRLRKKFRQLAEEFELNGGRLLPGESTAMLCPIGKFLTNNICFSKTLAKKKKVGVNQKKTEV